MQKHILPLFWCFIILSSSSVKPVKDEIKWSSLKEVSLQLKEQQKPVLVDIYTDWCHWCKVMDKKTYTNEKVIDYLNQHFYTAKVNAETKENLVWNKKSYVYDNKYLINQFVLYATNGQPGFPTTVILAGENAEPVSIAGYLQPKELEPVLKYFGEGKYKTQTFEAYKKSFKSSW